MRVKMTTSSSSGAPRQSILIVHGRGFKPSADTYQALSTAALRAGLERDYPDCVDAFDRVAIDTAYYGDLAALRLTNAGKAYDEALDVGDRRNALAALVELRTRKKFGIQGYDRLPGKSAIREACVNFLAPLFGGLGLWPMLLRRVSRDFACYFDASSDYRETARQRLREQLCRCLDRGDSIALLSHGTGAVVAYDVLWQLSNDAAFSDTYGERKIDLWLTLGAPLGDANVQKRLIGAKDKNYPTNLVTWHNIAAEDDYTCHDNTVADDFRRMLKRRLISAIHDHKVYNLAVRYGRSNPHSSIGYFIHPRVAKILAAWLQAETD